MIILRDYDKYRLLLLGLDNFSTRIKNAYECGKKEPVAAYDKKIIYGKKIIRIELFYLPTIDNYS